MWFCGYLPSINLKRKDGVMKKIILALFAALATFSIYAADVPKGWTTDLNQALAEAKKSNRKVLLLFTGSDWCHYCIKLKSEVLDKEQFKKMAAKNFVLVYFDFPSRKKIDGTQRAKQNHIARKFGITGYPTTLILSPDGKKLDAIDGALPLNSYLQKLSKYAKENVSKKDVSKKGKVKRVPGKTSAKTGKR